jgi:hypothetical protein
MLVLSNAFALQEFMSIQSLHKTVHVSLLLMLKTVFTANVVLLRLLKSSFVGLFLKVVEGLNTK